MSQIQLLYQLQQTDNELREKKKRLAEVLQAQKETEELKQARARAETAVSTLTEWQTTHRNLSQEVESVNHKAKSAETRLYSGNVTNPKELSDLQNQIAAFGRRRAALEDDILEAMIMIEEAEAEDETATESYATVKAAWTKSQSGYKEEQNTVALRLHHLMGLRKQQAGKIEPRLLQEYDHIGKRSNGVAVARLKLNSCQGCRITVSANKVKEAQEGKKTYCGGCGRILCPT